MREMHPLQMWMHTLEVSKISKTNMPISPLETCDVLPHLHVASVLTPCLEALHF